MIYCYLVVVLHLILIIFAVDHVLTFRVEEIVGGYTAYPENYKYHASIIGQYDNSNYSYLLCGAVIISDYLLLAAARCFIEIHENIKKITYYASVGQLILSGRKLVLKDIEKIYMYAFSYILNRNDLAVIQLEESLGLQDNSNLSSVEIASPSDSFFNRSGTVTGFGATSPNAALFQRSREKINLNIDEQHELKYAFAQFASEMYCRMWYNNFNNDTSFCAVINSDYRYRQRGICVGDIGNPFVIDEIIVGIVSLRRPECDDTIRGSQYTKVSYFHRFIDAIKGGYPLRVLAFRAEKIVGGYTAFPVDYKYHAAIIGKYHDSTVLYVLCSAAIISDHFLLGSARCFLHKTHEIRNITFYASVGHSLLSHLEVDLKDIKEIYTHVHCFTIHRDIAAIKLQESLKLKENSNLATVKIASSDHDFFNRTGTVTGFGATSLDDPSYHYGKEQVKLYPEEYRSLKYIFSKFATEKHCAAWYKRLFNNNTEFCAVIKPDQRFRHRGLCVGDLGNPFVIDNTIVGIASIRRPECDDTERGTLYTKVSFFHPIIIAIIKGDPLPESIIHYNTIKRMQTVS